MTKAEADSIIEVLINEYGTRFEIDSSKKLYWENDLSQYDYEEVLNNLKPLLSDRLYSSKGPNLSVIVKGLTRISDRVDFSKLTWFCEFCRRPFNNHDDLIRHEDRDRSVRYIEAQYEKYNWGTLNKRELYSMPEEEFDAKYKKFLRKIQEVTTDLDEKRRIENIFNPPKEVKNGIL